MIAKALKEMGDKSMKCDMNYSKKVMKGHTMMLENHYNREWERRLWLASMLGVAEALACVIMEWMPTQAPQSWTCPEIEGIIGIIPTWLIYNVPYFFVDCACDGAYMVEKILCIS